MTEHEPGRELDVMVHRALWPDDTVVVSDFVQSYRRTIGENPYSEVWSTIPFYSTDITAWDWTRRGWGWDAAERPAYIMVTLKAEIATVGAGADYRDHDNNRFRAQAFARSLCVLQWAETKEG